MAVPHLIKLAPVFAPRGFPRGVFFRVKPEAACFRTTPQLIRALRVSKQVDDVGERGSPRFAKRVRVARGAGYLEGGFVISRLREKAVRKLGSICLCNR